MLVCISGLGVLALLGALTSEIVRVAFVHQVDTVILQTNNPVAYRVYQRIGFLPVAMLAPCHRD